MSHLRTRGLFQHLAGQLESHEAQQALHRRKDILEGKGFLIYDFLSENECKSIIKASESVGYDMKSSGSRCEHFSDFFENAKKQTRSTAAQPHIFSPGPN
jgi:hypothetical protein